MDQDNSPITPEFTEKTPFHVPRIDPLAEEGEEDLFVPPDSEDLIEPGAPDEMLSIPLEAQEFIDNTQLYLRQIGYSPLLTAEEEVYFARRALQGDLAARRRMIESIVEVL